MPCHSPSPKPKMKQVYAILFAVTILIIIIVVNYPPPRLTYSSFRNLDKKFISTSGNKKCDIFTGEWVRNVDAPYYTNSTCLTIHNGQNCMKYGRPDSEYLKWRWRPDGCELPVFDPVQFLAMHRDKTMAFVGDSVGRNHMQALICLLSRVETPKNISVTSDARFNHFKYIGHNFTIAAFWAPYLVRWEDRGVDRPVDVGFYNIYLDEPDESWTTQIDNFDYVFVNARHWFSRTTVYYENGGIIGCHICRLPNVTELPMQYAYRRALRTAFKAINERENLKGLVYLRTFTPSHFEGRRWDEGATCPLQRPFRRNETALEGSDPEMYAIQMEEFRVAERERRERWRLLDMTKAMLLRPDGHPSKYGHWPIENVTFYNDCVHWCLPGPIDSWADFLFYLIKMEKLI